MIIVGIVRIVLYYLYYVTQCNQPHGQAVGDTIGSPLDHTREEGVLDIQME